jgi:hypothetical protein
MHKKLLQLSLIVLSLAPYQSTLAHGSGGGDKSFVFDKNNRAVDREAIKKAAEKKNEQDDWAEFMNEVNKPEEEQGHEKSHDHNAEASDK